MSRILRISVRAEHIDGSTPKDEREATLARLAAGEIELVTNCMVLTEGWDMPDVGAYILARPTKKMGLFRQMIGRVIRPAPGKVDAIVLDHSGAVYRHGFVEDEVVWTLDPGDRATSPTHTARCENYQSRLLECTQCSALRVGGQPCPNCGFLPQRPPRAVSFIDGDLNEVGRDRRVIPPAYTQQELIIFYAELRRIAEQRGYKTGWAAQQYRTKFGSFPPWAWNQGPNLHADRFDVVMGSIQADRLREGEGFLMIRERQTNSTAAPDQEGHRMNGNVSTASVPAMPAADAEYVLAALRCTSRRLKLIDGQIIEIGVALSRRLISPQSAIDGAKRSRRAASISCCRRPADEPQAQSDRRAIQRPPDRDDGKPGLSCVEPVRASRARPDFD